MKASFRLLVDLGRCRHLHEPATVHDTDAVGHGHRLFLVVGDDDEGGAEADLQVHELELRLLAQLLVEGGERLVQEQHLRPFRQRAGERDALALSAGQLLGIAGSEAFELHEPQRLVDARGDLLFREAVLPEAEGDVARDAQVREQGVGLKHHVHGPPIGRHAGQVLAGEQDAALRRNLEAGEDAQQRAFSTPGRPKQAEELALEDAEGEIIDGGDAAEMFADVLEADQGNGGGIAPGREGAADGADGRAGHKQLAQFPIGLLP